MMSLFPNLPTAADVAASRVGKPILKGDKDGKSRRQVNDDAAKDESKAERDWRKAVMKRDGDECRWCQRKVIDCLDRVGHRREIHHVNGRVVRAIRWDRRNGIQLCGTCHDRVTGAVNEKHLIYSKHTFTVDDIAYINADKPVKFKRVA